MRCWSWNKLSWSLLYVCILSYGASTTNLGTLLQDVSMSVLTSIVFSCEWLETKSRPIITWHDAVKQFHHDDEWRWCQDWWWDAWRMHLLSRSYKHYSPKGEHVSRTSPLTQSNIRLDYFDKLYLPKNKAYHTCVSAHLIHQFPCHPNPRSPSLVQQVL